MQIIELPRKPKPAPQLAAGCHLAFGAAALSSPASIAGDDACSRLTPAEVGAALGTAAGEPITPTEHEVCTWKAGDGKSWVTLMLQTPVAFDSGKKLAGVSKNVVLTPASGLGEDANYLAVSDQVGLVVKSELRKRYNFGTMPFQSASSKQTGKRVESP